MEEKVMRRSSIDDICVTSSAAKSILCAATTLATAAVSTRRRSGLPFASVISRQTEIALANVDRSRRCLCAVSAAVSVVVLLCAPSSRDIQTSLAVHVCPDFCGFLHPDSRQSECRIRLSAG